MIATGSQDQKINLWNFDFEKIGTLEGHKESVLCVSFSLDFKKLFSADCNNQIIMWDLC